jgi:hypothetical protein
MPSLNRHNIALTLALHVGGAQEVLFVFSFILLINWVLLQVKHTD